VSSACARLAASGVFAGFARLVHGAQVWSQDADFTAFAAVDIVRV
jgi:hypothetical protein